MVTGEVEDAVESVVEDAVTDNEAETFKVVRVEQPDEFPPFLPVVTSVHGPSASSQSSD